MYNIPKATMTTSTNEMKELMLANSKWEALYRTTLTELNEADRVIVRLSVRIQDLTERQLFQNEELKQTKNMLDQRLPGLPVRQSNRLDDDFMMRPSVDLLGNKFDDTTSLCQMPLTVDELETIGNAQEKYYEQMEIEYPLQAMKTYTSPPCSPHVNTVPPVLKRGTNNEKMDESELWPNVTVRDSFPEEECDIEYDSADGFCFCMKKTCFSCNINFNGKMLS